MSLPPSPLIKRLVCPRCERAQKTCICHWVTPTQTRVEVLILQHPLEVGHAKGSARLLHLSLVHSRLIVGEKFESHHLGDTSRARSLLLYPQTPTESWAPPPVLDADWLNAPDRLRLIVLDATWRKSRKMLHCSPALQQLPRLSLMGLPASRYRIRKAHQADQLCTLEATCAALAQLDGGVEHYAPLLNAFEGFVEQQIRLQPASNMRKQLRKE